MMLFLGALARLPGILQGRINFCCSVDGGEPLLSRHNFDNERVIVRLCESAHAWGRLRP